MTEMKSTTDYDIFNTLVGNRKVALDPGHLKKMKASISADNQLNIHPIAVNKDFEVIDGQFRLEAARQLGVPIFYIKSDTVSDMHIITCNSNQKAWNVENYISFFETREQIPDYLLIKNMLKQASLQPKSLLSLMLGRVSAPTVLLLKCGKFRFPKSDEPKKIFDQYLIFIDYCKKHRITPIGMFKSNSFTSAFHLLMKTSGFDDKIFYEKMDLRWFELKPQPNSADWYKLLVGIYNYRNRDSIGLENV